MSAGGEGDAIFWPGFVDALSNLVLVLLFVVMILAMTVAYVAMQAGAKSAQKLMEAESSMGSKLKMAEEEKSQLKAQIAQLQAALQKALEAAKRPAVSAATGSAKGSAAQAGDQIEPSGTVELSANRDRVLVRFPNESTSFDVQSEGDKLKDALKQLGKSAYVMEVPAIAGISISKRKAFLRLVAVRNAMLAKGIDVKSIQVKIVEHAGLKADALATLTIKGVP